MIANGCLWERQYVRSPAEVEKNSELRQIIADIE